MRERAGRFAASALAAAAALLLGACTKADVATSTATADGARHAWTESGHLRYGSAYEPDNLNPLFANTQAANDIAYAVFEPVFRYDPDGNFVPAAVTDVPTAENGGIARDGKTITLHFRPGMKWSDGAPYDARDLIFTWHAVMNPRNNTRLQVGWDDIASMRARARQPDRAHPAQARQRGRAGRVRGRRGGLPAAPRAPAGEPARHQPRRVQRQAHLERAVRAERVEPRLGARARAQPVLLARQAGPDPPHLPLRAQRRDAALRDAHARGRSLRRRGREPDPRAAEDPRHRDLQAAERELAPAGDEHPQAAALGPRACARRSRKRSTGTA